MIQHVQPDKRKALSLIQASENDIGFTLTLKPNKSSGNTIVRNIYECFRMLGEALLISRGIKSDDHILPINELMKMDVNTTRPISLLDNLRRLRHNINYQGYSPSVVEVEDVISLAKSCFEPLKKTVLEKIGK